MVDPCLIEHLSVQIDYVRGLSGSHKHLLRKYITDNYNVERMSKRELEQMSEIFANSPPLDGPIVVYRGLDIESSELELDVSKFIATDLFAAFYSWISFSIACIPI